MFECHWICNIARFWCHNCISNAEVRYELMSRKIQSFEQTLNVNGFILVEACCDCPGVLCSPEQVISGRCYRVISLFMILRSSWSACLLFTGARDTRVDDLTKCHSQATFLHSICLRFSIVHLVFFPLLFLSLLLGAASQQPKMEHVAKTHLIVQVVIQTFLVFLLLTLIEGET